MLCTMFFSWNYVQGRSLHVEEVMIFWCLGVLKSTGKVLNFGYVITVGTLCWGGRPFDHNRHGPRSEGSAVPLSGGGELGLHLTQCGLGRDLPAYQVATWSVQLFGHNTQTSQTDGTDNGPIGYDEPFYKRTSQKLRILIVIMLMIVTDIMIVITVVMSSYCH